MENNNLQLFLKNKKIFVISPHFDDAVLSAGMFLYKLKNKADITVINIFTKSHSGPYTFSAKKFLRDSGYNYAEELYKKRYEEDKKAMSIIKAKVVDLELIDGLFRRKKNNILFGNFLAELNHLYPTYRLHLTGGISKNDYAPSELSKKLKRIISQDSLILIPLGIGNHVDHVITRNVSEKLFTNILYYADFPYNLKSDKPYNLPEGYKRIILDVDLKIKSNLIRQYKSQVDALFNKGIIPEHQEEFFFKNKSL